MYKNIARRYWSQRGKTYDSTPGHSSHEGIWRRILTIVIRSYSEVIRRCVDIGCGTGFMTKILQELGPYVVCLDISRDMLMQAKAKLWRISNVDIIEADAENLPIRNGSIDLAVSRHVIWTLQDPVTAIREWLRILKSSGVIVSFDGTWCSNCMFKRTFKVLLNIFRIVTKYNVSLRDSLKYNLLRIFRKDNIEIVRKMLKICNIKYIEIDLTFLKKLLISDKLQRDYSYYMIIIRKSRKRLQVSP
ncbi:MAG: methyltransferase domain-containing protein [Crenarchaeota archaeon]|nr:methyltransferase domain-containing protein [Thermoproteota archaeon]